jgi:hypothetical protein
MRRSRSVGTRRAVAGYRKTVGQLEDILAAMSPAHDYRAFTVTTSSGNISTVPNQGSAGGNLAVVSSTIAEPAVDAALLGELSITISNRTLQSSLAPAAFGFCHNGVGGHTFCVFVPTTAASRCVWATRSFAGTERGAGFFYQSTQSINFQASNGTNNIFAHASGAASVPLNAGALIENSYIESRAPFEAVTTRGSAGTLINATNTGAAPSASDPTSTLRIGNSSGDILVGECRWARWIGFDRVLSDADRAKVLTLLARRYGV